MNVGLFWQSEGDFFPIDRITMPGYLLKEGKGEDGRSIGKGKQGLALSCHCKSVGYSVSLSVSWRTMAKHSSSVSMDMQEVNNTWIVL